jgi:hypothetical protein
MNLDILDASGVSGYNVEKGIDITVIRHPERGTEGRQIGNNPEEVQKEMNQKMEENIIEIQ